MPFVDLSHAVEHGMVTHVKVKAFGTFPVRALRDVIER
jgi:hypothetical protein